MSTLKEICKEQTELLNECRQNIKELTEENEQLERENENYIKLLKEFNGFIKFKLLIHPGSDVYMYYRSELNKLGVK